MTKLKNPKKKNFNKVCSMLWFAILFLLLFSGVSEASLREDKIDPVLREVISDDYIEVVIKTTDQNRLSNSLRDARLLGKEYLVYKINSRDLETLSSLEEVSRIYLNREYSLLLDDSLPLIGANEYWDEGFEGGGINIAILDTGIDSDHELLNGKVSLMEAFVTDDPEDYQGHGTHVAGIASSVAPGASLLNAKVLSDQGKGSTESITNGIYWAVENGADVVSISIGAPSDSQDEVINEAIDYAISNGVVVVIASGNCGPQGSGSCQGYEGVTIPGSFEPAITVGAVNNNLEWATFSSGNDFGSYIKPDVVAPGVNIMSSVPYGYATKKGTSMATPFVSGVVALLLEENPSLDHYAVKDYLESNALDLGVEGKDEFYGSGFFTFNNEPSIPNPELEVSETKATVSSHTPVESNLTEPPLEVAAFESSENNPFSTEGCGGGRICGNKCWSGCGNGNWNCKNEDEEGTCCPSNAPYYIPNGDACTDDPGYYGCSYTNPYPCDKNNYCWPEPAHCEVSEYCGGEYKACLNPNNVGSCYNGEYYCCDEDVPHYWPSDDLCHAQPYEEGPGCSDNQCLSEYWGQCFDSGETCCEGDNTDGNPDTEFPQYYCKNNGDWASCSEDYKNMNGCQQIGDYYCTHNEGLWKLRECELGCIGNECVESVCGNGFCEDSESKNTCPQDCYSNLKIEGFTNPPTQAISGEFVTVKVRVKNYGTSNDNSKIEASIIPKNYFSSDFENAWQTSAPKCCSQNEYYDAKEISLAPGEEEDVIFSFYAPTQDSVDHCGDSSAWGEEFWLFTALYDQCCTQGDCNVQQNYKKSIEVVEQCTSDLDCVDLGYGYKCNFDQNPHECVYDPCPGECNNYNQLSCGESGNVQQCVQQEDGCYEQELVESCYGNEVCVEGNSECSTPNKKTQVRLENAAKGQKVYKQPGDILNVKLDHKQSESISFQYNDDYFMGDCPTSTSINSDIFCTLTIDEDTPSGNYNFRISGSNTEVIEVINSPTTLIITHKPKLYSRFGDNSGVNTLLEQAYETARENNGIVYDVSQYLGDHPFGSFNNYNPDPNMPSLSANAYALVLGNFIDSKCDKCRNIMILGDDYVIPHYRVDYADISFWNWFSTWFETNTQTEYLFTDQPYIKETKKNMGDLLTLISKDEFDSIVIVIKDNPSGSLSSEVNELKSTLSNIYGYGNNDIDTYYSNEIDCDSYSKLKKGTLIVIGDRDNNNAIKCLPWFDVGSLESDSFKASIEIERNVWGLNKYAIVISGDDLVSGVANFNGILENPFLIDGSLQDTNSVYIHDMSNPPDLPPNLNDVGDHIGGFVLGTCDTGSTGEKVACSATDFTLSVVPPADIITDVRDVLLYCPTYIWNKATGQKGQLMDGLICGGSTLGTGITVGKYVGIASVVGAVPAGVAGTAADAGTTIYKRMLKLCKVIFKGESTKFIQFLDKLKLFKFSNLKVFFQLDSATDISGLWNGWKVFKATLGNHKMALRVINNEFTAETLSQVLKTADDIDSAAKATKSLMKLGAKMADIPYNQIDKAKFLKEYGDLAKKFNIPEAGLKEVQFLTTPGAKGMFRITSKIIEFPASHAPKIATIGHELGHADSLYKMSVKLKNIAPELSEKIAKNTNNYVAIKLRGIAELLADQSNNKHTGTKLAIFIDEIQESGTSLITSSGIQEFVYVDIIGQGLTNIDVVNYLAYVQALAKKSGQTQVTNAIEQFLNYDGVFSAVKAETLDLAEVFYKEVNLLDKSSNHIKNTIELVEQKIDLIMTKI
jgi:hypothetical protein